jgi:hypothetical protein
MPKTVGLIPMKAQIERIQSAYSGAAKRIVDVLSGLDPATFTTVEHGQALRKVKEIVLILNDQVRMWALSAIRTAYDESAGIARTRLELIGAKQLPAWKYNPARHDRKIDALVRFVSRDFFKANLTIEKTAKKFLGVMATASAGVAKVAAQVQEFDPEEVRAFIKRTVAGSLRATTKYNEGMAHLTSKDIAAKIMTKLKDMIGGGDFIKINGRNYNLKDYSELVARTRMREAQSEATKELAQQFDNDLVQFSKHDSPCEECAPLEGMIFSISGNDEEYPELTDEVTPPVHPRCEHSLNPTSREVVAWRAS